MRAGFDEQRRLHHRDAVGIEALDFVHPAVLAPHHLGVNDGVQFADAVRENDVGEPGAIDGAVVIQDLAAEVADDFVVSSGPGRINLVRKRVRRQEMCAAFDQHGRDRGLAAGNAARQSYAEHGISLRIEQWEGCSIVSGR